MGFGPTNRKNQESRHRESNSTCMSERITRTEEKMWPELETFNSHSTQQWSLAQQSDWQLIPIQWQFSDTSFLLLLVCLLTQAEAWHSDKKLTKSPQGKMKNKTGIRYLDLILSSASPVYGTVKRWKGGRALVMGGINETGGQTMRGESVKYQRVIW